MPVELPGRYNPPPEKLLHGSIVDAYLRDSGGPAQEKSVEQQEIELRRYCQLYELVLRRVYKDIRKTGTTKVGRVQFNRMVQDITQSPDTQPAGVILWNYARFARELQTSTFYKYLIRNEGIVVHSLTDNIPEGRFAPVVEMLVDFSNEDFSLKISNDVRRALRQHAEEGYSIGGVPPRGFLAKREVKGTKRDGSTRYGSRWYIDPELGPLVTLAWTMRAKGCTYAELNKATQGRLYKSKNSWSHFFRNIAYLGSIKVDGQILYHHHPALVDQDTWDAVQKAQQGHPRYRKQNQVHHPRRQGARSLLSGQAFCIECGSAMVYSHNNEYCPWPYYICGKKQRQGRNACSGRMINARKADATVIDTVLNRVLTQEFFEALLAGIRSHVSNSQSLHQEIEDIERALASVKRSLINLVNLVEQSGSETVVERLKEREVEKAALAARLEQLKKHLATAQLEITPEVMGLILQKWRTEIETARDTQDIRALRELIFPHFVTRVELGYDLAHIEYTFSLEPEDASQTLGVLGKIKTMFIDIPQPKRPPRKQQPNPRNIEIFERHLAGETIRQLAGAYKLSMQRVWGICTQMRKLRRSEQEQNSD